MKLGADFIALFKECASIAIQNEAIDILSTMDHVVELARTELENEMIKESHSTRKDKLVTIQKRRGVEMLLNDPTVETEANLFIEMAYRPTKKRIIF